MKNYIKSNQNIPIISLQDVTVSSGRKHSKQSKEFFSIYRRNKAGTRRKSKAPFTLVEVLIAILVAGIIIGAAVALINVLHENMLRTTRISRATAIANNRIEQLHAVKFEDIELYEESQTQVNEQGTPSADGLYRRDTTIGPLSPSDEDNQYREVTVKVQASSLRDNPDIDISLSTIIVDRKNIGN